MVGQIKDTILCHDKEEAKLVIDAVGSRNIDDWEFLENGKVRIYLNCQVSEIADSHENEANVENLSTERKTLPER